MKPAERFELGVEETREKMRVSDVMLSARAGSYSKFAEEFEKKGMKYYLILGADVPAFGYKSKALQKYLIEVVREGWTFYPSKGTYMFIEAISAFEKKFSNLDFSKKDIIPAPGCGGGWNLLHRTLLEPGDEIVTISPCHYLTTMARLVRYLGAKIIPSPCIEEEEWEPDLEKLRANITKKTKFIELDYPNNPTGVIYSEKARKEILNIAGEYDIPVISDEMYELITFDGKKAPSMATLSNDVPVICMRSFSKMFMAPGWRVGWMSFHDPQERITEFKNACKHPANSSLSTNAIPLPLQMAATRVLKACMDIPKFLADQLESKDPMSELKDMVRELQTHRDYTYKRISEMEGISMVKPVSTLYGIPRVEGIGKIWKTDDDFLLGLMAEEGVAFAKAADYGAPGHFRTMLMPRIPELEDIFNRLERFISRHSK